MKRIILCVFFTMLVNTLYAQFQTGFHYKIKNIYKPFIISRFYFRNDTLNFFYTSDSAKTNDNNAFKNSYKKTICLSKKNRLKANLIQDDKNPSMLIINFWGFSTDLASCKKDTNVVSSVYKIDKKHFFFTQIELQGTLSHIKPYKSIPYVTTEIGVVSIPYKYRFGSKRYSIPNDVSTGVGGGIYIGRKWGRTRFFNDKLNTNSNSVAFTVGVFLSPIVIALSEEVTKKVVKTKSNEMGGSIGIAAMLSFSNVNLGIISGIDFPISGDSNKWIYANRPWVGFGIGYKLGIFGEK